MRKLLVMATVLATAFTLTACGPEGDIEDALSAKLAKEKVCWQFGGMRWPGQERFPVNLRGARTDATIQTLISAGVLSADETPGRENADVLTIDLTDKGRSVGVFDEKKNGFCYGHQKVKSLKLQERGGDQEAFRQFEYRWVLEPESWAKGLTFGQKTEGVGFGMATKIGGKWSIDNI